MALNCVIKFLFAIFGDTVDLRLRVLHYCRHLIRGEPGGLMFIRVSTPKLVIVAKFGLQRLPGFRTKTKAIKQLERLGYKVTLEPLTEAA